ncbi:MAG TPA: methionyl-tRNA formyltransferase, partial [Bacillota bacterium]|nr:methionyl-tRNA formyltransferase [Bacillota bacterium]
ELHNQIRGMNPWPGAYTTFDGKRLKLWRSRPAGIKTGAPSIPGAVLEIDRESMIIATGAGALAVQEVQPQGKRPMAAADFCRGYRLVPGAVLGQEAGERS